MKVRCQVLLWHTVALLLTSVVRTRSLFVPLILASLFFSSLKGDTQLAFRDVGHFYTPLYEYVAKRSSQDALPLWNPLDQTGIPLLGETTTAVLYPLRYIVFSLPLATGTAMAWYVVLHLWIASITAWTAAHWSGASRSGCALASVIYPFSGSILFLYTNPPFLVAASWLPLVLGACLAKRKLQTTTRVLAISVSLALMVLGGDPQTALHAVIVCSCFLLFACVFSRQRDATNVLIALVCGCLVAAMLSLPQLAASMSWTQQSYRALNDEPQNLWTPPTTGSQQYDAFSYSMPPWHLLELYVPRAFGDLFPIYRRWSVLLPGDGRVWTPSLYASLFAFLALVCTYVSRRMDRWNAVALFAVFCAMGHFGLAWFVNQFTSRFDEVDSAAGGMYWFLYHFFPGYDAFRYPTKWLPFLSLSLAIISAKFLDRTKCPNFVLPRRTLIVLACGLVILAAVSYWFQNHWTLPNRLPRDRFWGPLDISGGTYGVFASLAMLASVVFVLRSRNVRQLRHVYVGSIVLLVALDLALNGRHMIATVDQEQVAMASASPTPITLDNRYLRTATEGGFPKSWREASSPHRMLEVEATQRATWFGRWHLDEQVAVFNNMTSIRGNSSTRFWQAVNTWSKRATLKDQHKLWSELMDWLAIDGVVTASDQSIDLNGLRIGKPAFISTNRKSSSINLHSTWSRKPAGNATKSQMLQLLDKRNRQGRSTLVTVYSDSADAECMTPTTDTDGSPKTNLVGNHDELAVYEVSLPQRILLTRAILQDGHWNATLRSRDGSTNLELDVLNVDHLTQGVVIPSGDWMLTFEYRPKWLSTTLVVALIFWLTWMSLAVRGLATTFWCRVRPVR